MSWALAARRRSAMSSSDISRDLATRSANSRTRRMCRAMGSNSATRIPSRADTSAMARPWASSRESSVSATAVFGANIRRSRTLNRSTQGRTFPAARPRVRWPSQTIRPKNPGVATSLKAYTRRVMGPPGISNRPSKAGAAAMRAKASVPPSGADKMAISLVCPSAAVARTARARTPPPTFSTSALRPRRVENCRANSA